MKKKITFNLLIILFIVLLAACGNSENENGAEGNDDGENTNLSQLIVGAGPQGASYYSWGAGWSNIMGNQFTDSNFSVEATDGPSDNIELIESGDMDFGWSTAWLAGEAYNGEGWAEKKYENIRSVFPMYSSVLYVYSLQGNGINSMNDLNGKRLSTGNAGSTSDLGGHAILNALEIEVSDITPISTDIAVNNLKDSLLDANIAVSGVPAPFLMDLETTHDIQYIGLNESEINITLEHYPYWNTKTLEKGTYQHLEEDIDVVEFWNIALASKELPEDFVYEITKKTFENREDMIAADTTAEQMIEENILYTTVPLHLGALKYYEEIGIDIPDHLIPPEKE